MKYNLIGLSAIALAFLIIGALAAANTANRQTPIKIIFGCCDH